ncbi:MAG: NAD(P)-dependent oxidoreductase [Gemmatimonadota bacterium]|nr:NAD(P)-dependent oxidoreductase [Gemmatimonadota bacterium]
MRIFVAGATGVIGTRIVPLLVAAGHDVTGVCRTDQKLAALQQLGARGVGVDLFDADAVRRAVARHDVVINLATAVPSPTRMLFPGAWRAMDRVRRQVSTNLANAALADNSVGRLVQESFAPIYADAGDRWIDESSPVTPARYNRSVVDAELNAMRVASAGRAGVVLRFGAFYGPGDPLVEQVVGAVRRGWFPLFGNPDGYFSFVAHEDAAAAVVAALGVPAGIYNVVEHDPMRRRELAEGVAQLVGVGPPRFLPRWVARLAGTLGETLGRSLRISNRKLEAATGWAPKYRTTLDGFRAIVSPDSAESRGASRPLT